MKKILLGTTALIASATIASSAFAAPELTVNGNLNFQWTGGDNPAFGEGTGGAANTRGQSVGNRQTGWQFDQLNSQSELKFHAEGESDGGVSYGAQIDYRYLNNDADEAYIFVSGDFGTVHFGRDDGAVDQTKFYAGSVSAGAVLIDGTSTSIGYNSYNSSDATKILYVSNELNGFKFAVSAADAQTGNTWGNHEDIYELGAQYNFDIIGGSWGVSGGFVSASAAGPNVTETNTVRAGGGAATIEDVSEYVIGIKGTYGDISFVASYADAGESGYAKAGSTGYNDKTLYTLGVGYNLGGGMAISAAYGESEGRAASVGEITGTVAGDDLQTNSTNTLYTLDFGFPIMDGMSGYAGIAFSEQETDANTVSSGNSVAAGSIDATTYVVGTTVSF